MLLVNERNEMLDVEALKNEILNDKDSAVVTEDELEVELGDNYNQALEMDMQEFEFAPAAPAMMAEASRESFFRRLGRKILKKIRQFICSVLSPESGPSEILEAILDALASIIPGGRILKGLVKKLFRFIAGETIGNFCKAA